MPTFSIFVYRHIVPQLKKGSHDKCHKTYKFDSNTVLHRLESTGIFPRFLFNKPGTSGIPWGDKTHTSSSYCFILNESLMPDSLLLCLPSIYPSTRPSICPHRCLFLPSSLPSFLPSFFPPFLPSFLPPSLLPFLPSVHLSIRPAIYPPTPYPRMSAEGKRHKGGDTRRHQDPEWRRTPGNYASSSSADGPLLLKPTGPFPPSLSLLSPSHSSWKPRGYVILSALQESVTELDRHGVH